MVEYSIVWYSIPGGVQTKGKGQGKPEEVQRDVFLGAGSTPLGEVLTLQLLNADGAGEGGLHPLGLVTCLGGSGPCRGWRRTGHWGRPIHGPADEGGLVVARPASNVRL